MANDAVKKMFKNDTKAYIAVEMDVALERVVRSGLRLAKKAWFEHDLLLEALGNKAAPLIREILNSINPEVSKNIQGMDERVIWLVYWDLRSNPMDAEKISIFELLRELNNPPLAPAFA